ncbi:MAG: hypothetical protein HY717_22145, partial [Planctomycetes bacterium]|nr:hypothetical protein [Planctomycetota bacterium]
MTTFRHLILILFFVSLAVLEVLHGVYRLNSLRRGQRDKLVEEVTREHADLARRLRSLLTREREHAVFLARSPLVRDLLARPESKVQTYQELSSHLAAYLISFRGADRIQVVEASGTERFRCERIGQGVGVLPEEFLEKAPLGELAAEARAQRGGEVSISTLMVDQHRVEVSEADRQVLHYTTGIQESGKFLGALVLTVYAAPLLNEVRRFAPVAGVSAFLVDGDGSYLASADRSRERGGAAASHLARDYPEAAERILASANEDDGLFLLLDDSLFLSAPVIESPRWRLAARVPPEAFQAIAQPLSSEYLWVIGSMVAITAVLILAGVFFFRMSVRELRLREQARQKEMERQLQISERLGSLGLLTAGVAHEINNPLEGIGNYLALLERDRLTPEKRKRYLEHVQYGLNRIRDIVRDLLTFARPGASEGRADLALVVQRALKMVAYAKEFKEVQ